MRCKYKAELLIKNNASHKLILTTLQRHIIHTFALGSPIEIMTDLYLSCYLNADRPVLKDPVVNVQSPLLTAMQSSI